MSDSPDAVVRSLNRVRQNRNFTDEPPSAEHLQAIADVARWSGSSQNSQPWRFIVITESRLIRRIADAGMPQTRSLQSATAAIAIALPTDGHAISYAFDEGRAAERMLIAATELGLGAGIAWMRADARGELGQWLGLPDGWAVRTVMAIGHTEEARRPKSAPGKARLPRSETVFEERWPDSAEEG
jgi:nitroreductase